MTLTVPVRFETDRAILKFPRLTLARAYIGTYLRLQVNLPNRKQNSQLQKFEENTSLCTRLIHVFLS